VKKDEQDDRKRDADNDKKYKGMMDITRTRTEWDDLNDYSD